MTDADLYDVLLLRRLDTIWSARSESNAAGARGRAGACCSGGGDIGKGEIPVGQIDDGQVGHVEKVLDV
ncbi:hypothetical protein AB0M41_46870, partial [Streptomyces sp. NPDC051896]|uniref:hypothetical protein n=1 Tax=Streptomyces sp. NPDC051896 TaxID=3155416 RepID=UPI003447F253